MNKLIIICFNKRCSLFIYLIFGLIQFSFSQSTLITPGVFEPNIVANSNSNGILIPILSKAQKDGLTKVIKGTLVYDMDLNCLSIYNGSSWDCVNSPSNSFAPIFNNFNYVHNPSGKAPLSGLIEVTSSEPFKISYTVLGQDGEDFTFGHDKFSFNNDTTINLFGLYPSYTNTIIVTIITKSGYLNKKTFNVNTPPIPSVVPQLNEIFVNYLDNSSITKFIMFFPIKTQGMFNNIENGGYPLVIDKYGKVRWYLTFTSGVNSIIIPLKNGNWLLSNERVFKEIDLLGNEIRVLNLPNSYTYHHDVIQLPNENLVYLGSSSLNNTVEDKVYTMNFSSGEIIDSLNLYPILDPLRPQLPAGASFDWFHANSIVYNSIDSSFIISGRHQSSIIKVGSISKQLIWILSDSTNWNNSLKQFLLNPIGNGFEYFYGQHSAILKPSDKNTILLFDNGNNRSYSAPVLPNANFSRAVEYSIDEANKTVRQNFEYGKTLGAETFAPYVGKVHYLNNDRIFIGNGGILKDNNNNATDFTPNAINQVRFFETDRTQNVYLDISIKASDSSNLIGFRSYRSYPFKFK